TDSLLVQLHDGRDISEMVALNVTVVATPDPPTDVKIDFAPIAEDIAPGVSVGEIDIVDADGADGAAHTITISDPRFIFRDGQIIFVGNSLDFENEPLISIGVTVTDPETETVIQRSTAVRVRDTNEPIVGITPISAEVFENDSSTFIATIEVEDPDNDDSHTVTVDDSRFVIRDFALSLADNVSLDFEEDPTVTINVTAVDLGGDRFTQAIEITVIDVAEQPNSIELSNDTVMELVPGAEVGDVTLDGQTPPERYALSVNDPRFEIDGNLLKLLDDQIVERANQEEIEVRIRADDRLNEFTSITETFVIQVMENAEPYHNHDNPYDVDHNGEVTALDALAVINYLNTYGPGPVGPDGLGLCYDVNADGMVTALDALLILNELNRVPAGGTVGDGEKAGPEGEQIASPQQFAPSTPEDPEAERDGLLADAGLDDGLIDPKASDTTTNGSPIGPFELDDQESLKISGRQSAEQFAHNVDEMLRLLSDRDA
ncbi:MAG: dockerin type I domain-containing protein, partial [Rubripirellula sp.]